MTINNDRVEGIYNMVEPLVWTLLEKVSETQRDTCFCSLCRSDMVAYALNRLPAQYVSTQEGETIFKKFEIDDRVYEAVSEAILHVSKHPHRQNRMITEHTMNELFDSMDSLSEDEH